MAVPTNEPARLVKRARLAAAIDQSERKVADLDDRGIIPRVQVDGSVLYDIEDVVAALKAYSEKLAKKPAKAVEPAEPLNM